MTRRFSYATGPVLGALRDSLIQDALTSSQGNKCKAAKLSGISRTTILRLYKSPDFKEKAQKTLAERLEWWDQELEADLQNLCDEVEILTRLHATINNAPLQAVKRPDSKRSKYND